MEQKNFLQFILSGKLDKHLTCEFVMALIIIVMGSMMAIEYFSLEKRAMRGNTSAQIKLAEKCIKNNHLREAEFWLMRAGDNGDFNAMLKAGDFFSQGPESATDFTKAVKLYEQVAGSAEDRSLKAQAFMRLSVLYQKRDVNKAHKLLRKAAELDDPEAQWRIGIFYREQKNESEALKWFGRAADANYSKALLELGVFYLNKGESPEALRLFNKAAEQHDLEALHLLGQLYYLGKGVERDENKAEQYFLEAAVGGLPAAQSDLAVFYSYKYKKNEDSDTLELAEYWAKRAWASGIDDVKL